MAVSEKMILNKIEAAIIDAKKEEGSLLMREHIRSVKLLCELLLDEEINDVREEEGEQAGVQRKATKTYPVVGKSSTIDHGEANGKSIFDF